MITFIGTHPTNVPLSTIANEYVQRQIGCAKAGPLFSTEPACRIDTSPGQLFVIIFGPPLKMRITAMALPWGGLSDIGPDAGCIFDYDGLKSTPPTECKEWKEPHQTHNDGKNVDIGFGGLNSMNQQLRLLRDVIIDNSGQLPYDTEGRDMSKTKDHFHVKFNN